MGCGSYANVVKAVDKCTNETVAIKLLIGNFDNEIALKMILAEI